MSETVKIQIVGIHPLRKAVEENKGRIKSIIEKGIGRMIRQQNQDLNHQMAEFMAMRTPFSAREIYSFFEAYGSWDKVMIACGYAPVYGDSRLDAAYFKAVKDNPGLTTEALLRKYHP